MTREADPASAKGSPRSAARLAAAQALYEIELSGQTPDTVATKFFDRRDVGEAEGEVYAAADRSFFADLVRGASARLAELDTDLDGALGPARTPARLEAILRAILRLGPIPLPTRREIYTVNRSPFIDKKSREQFEIRTHKRIIDITEPNSRTVEALNRLVVPAGVFIKIKA